jgi:hypothetical protein
MLADLYILEPELMRWTRPTAIGKMPRPRAGHTCTAIGPAPQLISERTVAIQSANKNPDESSPRRGEEESYSSPRSLPSAPSPLSISGNGSIIANTPISDDPATSSMEANGAAAANLIQPSQRLLFFGGGDNDGFMNDLHLLEIDTLTWSPVFTAGSSPSPRSRHSATLVKSTLWVIGGLGEGQNVFNDVYTLNTTSMVWSKPVLKGNPMNPRWGHSAIRSGSNIIIFGGHNGVEVMNDLHILDTDSNSWRVVEPTSVQSIAPPALDSHSIVVECENEVVSSAVENAKTSLPASLFMTTIPPSPRCGHSANFVLLGRERKMVVFGGSNTGGDVFNDTIVLDLDTLQWMHLNIKGSLPQARSVHSCNTVEDKLFVIGGIDSTRRFKDIYTLSLTSLVHVEDPGMAPLRGRPRRSSRASPRVVSLSSPNSSSNNGGSSTSTMPVSPTSASLTSSTSSAPPVAGAIPPTHPHLLQTRRSNEDIRSSDPGSSLLIAPLSVSIPNNITHHGLPLETVDEGGRLSPLTPNSSLSFSSPMRQRMSNSSSNSLRRSAPSNGSLSPIPLNGIPPSFLATSLNANPSFFDPQQHFLQNFQMDPLSQSRLNRSPNGSMESLPLLSPMAIFLSNLGLSRLIAKFEAEEIDMSVLPYLTEENLEYLGVNTLGARLRLTNAIQSLKHNPTQPRTSGSPLGSQLPLPPQQLVQQYPQNGTETLEASVERLVSTVLVATNTLTDTMHFITTKLNNTVQPSSSNQNTSPKSITSS